jgi:hypothetical protein
MCTRVPLLRQQTKTEELVSSSKLSFMQNRDSIHTASLAIAVRTTNTTLYVKGNFHYIQSTTTTDIHIYLAFAIPGITRCENKISPVVAVTKCSTPDTSATSKLDPVAAQHTDAMSLSNSIAIISSSTELGIAPLSSSSHCTIVTHRPTAKQSKWSSDSDEMMCGSASGSSSISTVRREEKLTGNTSTAFSTGIFMAGIIDE